MRVWLVGAVLVFTSVATRSSPRPPLTLSRTAEVARIRAHFDSVLGELRARDVSSYAPAQRAARARLLDSLAAYRDRGQFPENRDFAGLAVPYFIDRATGVHCAVAHLMRASGAGALAQRIASEDNNVWVAELTGNVAVAHWLTQHGLTLAEAARIQVPYMADDAPVAQMFGSSERAYAIGTAAVATPAVLSAWINARGNADGHRTAGRVLGFGAGIASVVFGTLAATDGNAPGYVAPVSLLSGAASAWLAARSQRRHTMIVAQQRASRVAGVQVAPLLPTRTSGAGLHVAMRF
ncbi:MAG: hypothetical protein MUF00_07245 [Gemmatimonadaceae bacterium]|jgi:hypothetical protein|nr:hypothetical protein [Gemmatimonadaceae bacterium]